MAQDRPAINVETIALIERLGRLTRSAEHGTGLNPAQWAALRFLARCNRFSNAPTAIADYLAATKGTISQSINTLERKGYIEKGQRPGEGRSITLSLTEKGRAALEQDPLWQVADHEVELTPQIRDGLARGLRHLIKREVQRQHHRSFGTCGSCIHFSPRRAQDRPHRCNNFDSTLTDEDLGRICYAHTMKS